MAFMQRRLPPLQRVFLNLDSKKPAASQSTLRRCRSFSDFTPFELSEVTLGSSFELGAKPCVAPVSQASDAVRGDQRGPESEAEDLPVTFPDTDDEEAVAWVEAQSANTVAPPAEDTASIDGLWLTPLAESAATAKDVPDYMPQRVAGFQHGFCNMPSGFTSFPNKGYASVNCGNTSTAQAFHNAWRNRMLTAPAGGSQQVDSVRLQVQGMQMNMEKWCGSHMHPDEKPTVSPQVLSTSMARPQTNRTTFQPSAEEQVTRAQRTGTMAMKKARAMMPAVDLQPTVPNVRPRRGRRFPRSSARPENRSQARRDS